MRLLAHTSPENARLWSQFIAQVLKRYQNAHAINIFVTRHFFWTAYQNDDQKQFFNSKDEILLNLQT